MEEIKLKGRSNRDVPVEQVIHYIVKDYRRMYYEHEKLAGTINALREQLLKQENEAVHRERRIDKLWDKLEAKQAEIENMKAKLRQKQTETETLRAKLRRCRSDSTSI